MRTNLYWVETGTSGRLAIMARLRAGDWLEDELRGLSTAGVHLVVSLLTAEEVAELELEGEERACDAAGLQHRSFPIPDRDVPSQGGATSLFISELAAAIAAGRSVVIHCRMGIGRSSLIAASVLGVLGVEPNEALAQLAEARGLAVPDTDAQRQWVMNFHAVSSLPTASQRQPGGDPPE